MPLSFFFLLLFRLLLFVQSGRPSKGLRKAKSVKQKVGGPASNLGDGSSDEESSETASMRSALPFKVVLLRRMGWSLSRFSPLLSDERPLADKRQRPVRNRTEIKVI